MKKLFLAGLLMAYIMGSGGCVPEQNTSHLEIQIQGLGEVLPGIEMRFSQGTLVDLHAQPQPGWKFSRWEGPVVDTLNPTTAILMDGPKVIKAIFVPSTRPGILEGPGGFITWRADGTAVMPRMRGEKDIEYILIHATSDAAANPSNPYQVHRIRDIFDDYGVESHYVIDRDGAIYQFVLDGYIAHHAGVGSWPGDPKVTNSMNRYALGIELLGIGTRADMESVIGEWANSQIKEEDRGYTEEQYSALYNLLRYLRELYAIPSENIIGHQAYDPRRKWDPGVLFEWNRLLD